MDKYEQSVQLARDAFTQFAAGEFADAIKLYNASFEVDPNAAALRGLGECYVELNQNREAIVHLAASTGLRPHAKVTFQLAEALLQGGHLDEAKRAAERAIALVPHYKAAHAFLTAINKRIADETNDSATQS